MRITENLRGIEERDAASTRRAGPSHDKEDESIARMMEESPLILDELGC